MKYKITEQYIRSEEKCIAECLNITDALLFVAKKSVNAQENKQKIIYRLYENEELIHTLNQVPVLPHVAKYAQEDAELEQSEPLIFTLLRQEENSPQYTHIASFAHKEDALEWVLNHQDKNASQYLIYKDNVLIKSCNTKTLSQDNTQNEYEKSASYRPTPLATRPVPPGFPVNCWVEEEDLNKDNKK